MHIIIYLNLITKRKVVINVIAFARHNVFFLAHNYLHPYSLLSSAALVISFHLRPLLFHVVYIYG